VTPLTGDASLNARFASLMAPASPDGVASRARARGIDVHTSTGGSVLGGTGMHVLSRRRLLSSLLLIAGHGFQT